MTKVDEAKFLLDMLDGKKIALFSKRTKNLLIYDGDDYVILDPENKDNPLKNKSLYELLIKFI